MRVVLLKMGATMPPVKAKYGDYEDWFLNALEIEHDQFVVIDATNNEAFPALTEFDALIISGSPHSVYERAPWSETAADWIEKQVRADRPVLGVCYGHQLIAQRLGGKVALSPGGREIGVCAVEKVADDPLFDGLPDVFDVVQTHSDAVLSPVNGARILAQSPQTPNQAMAIGRRVRTVQWHPEVTPDIIEQYILHRRDAIETEFDKAHVDRLLSMLKPVSSGEIILKNFLRHFVG